MRRAARWASSASAWPTARCWSRRTGCCCAWRARCPAPAPWRSPRTRSVERWVRRHRGQQRVLLALAPQDRRPQVGRVAGEDLVALRRLDDPGVLGQLVLELPRPPARVAGEHARPPDRAVEPLGVVGVGADEAEVAVHERAGQLRPVELREDDHRGLRHRAADIDGLRLAGQPRQVGHRLAHRRVGRAVEHEAHRALFGVLGDQHDRAREVGVPQDRGGEDELAAQRLGHLTIVLYRRRALCGLRLARCLTFLPEVFADTFALALPLWRELAARLTPVPPTGSVGADAALALPSSLLATTTTRRRSPRSSLVTR